MFIYLLFLLLIFFFPILIIPLGAFLLLILLLLPFKFTVDSLLNLVMVPSQIYKIATNPTLRKNHGLEHATVNILEREYGHTNLAGYAEDDGFYILGLDNVWQVEEAARRGIQLLKRGQKDLVIHQKCGTSVTVANFISAVIFLLLLLYTGNFSIIYMLVAILAANLVGPFLGQIVQKYFTTTGDVGDMEIEGARYAARDSWQRPAGVFVKTSRIPYISGN